MDDDDDDDDCREMVVVEMEVKVLEHVCCGRKERQSQLS